MSDDGRWVSPPPPPRPPRPSWGAQPPPAAGPGSAAPATDWWSPPTGPPTFPPPGDPWAAPTGPWSPPGSPGPWGPPTAPPTLPPVPWSPGPWARPAPPTPPTPSRTWPAVVAVLVVAVLALVGAGSWAATQGDVDDTATAVGPGTPRSTGPGSLGPGSTPSTTAPTTTAPSGERDPEVRLAPAPTVPTVQGPYAFIETEADGDPAAWDPCQPIRVVVNGRLAPPGADEIMHEAMLRVTEATGLVFEVLGPTDEAPSDAPRPHLQPDRYGEGYVPVLFSWTDETELADFGDRIDGLAYPATVTAPSGEDVHVTGEVALDGDEMAAALDRGDRDYVVTVAMHELGHLMGLDHVDDPDEVMYGDGALATAWGPGDLAGLALLGLGECEPSLWE